MNQLLERFRRLQAEFGGELQIGLASTGDLRLQWIDVDRALELEAVFTGSVLRPEDEAKFFDAFESRLRRELKPD